MSLNSAQCSEIVRGRLNLPAASKLRIQKNIPNALEVFSDRVILDDNKRHILLTPKTLTDTPVNGILNLAGVVASNQVLVNFLHLGNIYNQPARTFTSANVDTTNDVIDLANNRLTLNTRVRFTTTDVLPAPLLVDTDYYAIPTTASAVQFVNADTETVEFTSVGIGTQTILTPDIREEQPLSRLTNPELTSFPIAWMDTATDKFWWLIGNTLYVFAGDGSPITTELQFNVPFTASLSDFDNPPIDTLQNDYIDVLTEISAQGMAKDA